MADGMSRSRKKFLAGVVCGCKSQKRGKQVASKRFRRRVRIRNGMLRLCVNKNMAKQWALIQTRMFLEKCIFSMRNIMEKCSCDAVQKN